MVKKKKEKSGKKYFITSGSEVEVHRGADLREETPFGFVNPSRHVWKTCNSACGPKNPLSSGQRGTEGANRSTSTSVVYETTQAVERLSHHGAINSTVSFH